MQITREVLKDINESCSKLISDEDEVRLNIDLLDNLYGRLIEGFGKIKCRRENIF